MRTYRTLALIGTFIKIIGWLTVIGTVLSSCGLLVAGVGGTFALPSLTGQNIPLGGLAAGALGPVIVAVGVLVLGLVYGAAEIAAGELIGLFIDLSVSSQRSVQLLERLAPAPASSGFQPMPAPALPPQPYQAQ